MKQLRKVLLLSLIFLLAFSPAAFGMTGSTGLTKSKPGLTLQKPDHKLSERLLNPENPDEMVRIIVELENEPTIQRATDKGVLYKQLQLSERKTLESTVTKEQISIQNTIKNTAPTIKYKQNFTTVFNGFSAEVEAKYVENIAKLSGVKAVYESTEYQRPTEKPEMIYSKELVQAQQAWNDYEVKGEGMVVGIIDTGIDPSHKDMILTDDKTAEITKDEVDQLLQNGSIKKGKYFTAKVPFGYNYMDNNLEILDKGPDASMHGMHVAGTVGANGDEANGGIKGVAPESQLLALKVFGNDPLFPSTYGDIYIKAIDDAIKLGVDVINMSLGSTAGYVDANNPEQQAVKKATENGVLVAISAGNSALYGDGTFYNYAENQDYGLTGSPSVSHYSLGVASFENSILTAYSFKFNVDDKEAGRALYLLANSAEPTEKLKGAVEIVNAGLGKPSDFQGKDFKGKVALISRGEIAFTEKGLNAQAAGAAGVIIYNNADGTINMASDPAIVIPYMSILKSDGVAMKAELDAGKKVTVEFDGNFTNTANPNAGSMSDFTSWGPTPNLDFKPEITAPGGNIFSTLNNDKYGIMSGTSMAAPHVAGGAALVFEHMKEKFDVTKAERVQLAKNLLMNTAKPVVFDEEYGDFVSPRRQGAGLMQLANALSTNVVITNKATGEAKVALKEIKGNKATFTLEAKNYSDEEAVYDVDVAVQVDSPAKVSGVIVTAPNLIGSDVVTEEVAIDTLDELKVPANGTAILDVTIDVSTIDSDLDEIFTNGYFVDGFVTLTDKNVDITGNVPLSVPFYGFNGKWDAAPIFDYFAWDDMTYWGYTALADENGNFIMGGLEEFNPEHFGFSPNGDNVRDKAIPVFSLFRNAKAFKVQVLDESGKVIRTIRTGKDLTKHYIASATTDPYSYSPLNGWDGKINGKLAADGQYYIQLSAVIDYEGAEWQSIKFPVIVDTVAPTAKVDFDQEKQAVTVLDLQDEGGTDVEYWEVLLNDENISDALSVEDYEYNIEEDLSNEDEVTVVVWDSAGNYSEYPFVVNQDDGNEPVIMIENPEPFSIWNTGEIDVEGTVSDASSIEEFTINGEAVELSKDNKFNHTVSLEDGIHEIKVAAKDRFGKEIEISRKPIFVDATEAELTLGEFPANTTEDTVTIPVTIKDNFDEVTLTVNGDEKLSTVLSEPYEMNGYETTVDVELSLSEGTNEFTFEVKDLAGNSTTETIIIEKPYVDGERLVVDATNVSLKEGASKQLAVKHIVVTEGAIVNEEDVTADAEYSSSNDDVVTVEGGKLTAVGAGEAKVTISYEELTAEVTVKVKGSDIAEEIVISPTSVNLKEKETKQLTANYFLKIDGKLSDVKNVSELADYSSSNLEVATVNDKGLVTAVKEGSAEITVTYNGAEATVKVTVEKAVVETPDPDPKPTDPTPPTNPNPAPTPTPTPTPSNPGTVVVDEGKVADQVKDSAATKVQVEVAAPSEAQPKVNAELPAATLKAVADSSKPFVVKAGTTEVSVPSDVLKAIAEGTPTKATISVELMKDAKLPNSAKAASSVYDFTISVEKDGKTTAVSSFKSPVTVTVPTTETVKDPRKVAAFYLNEKTNALEYVGGKYANGKVVYKANHFSKYVVVENDKSFTDVSKHWAKDEIEVLASRTITSGKTDTTFNPEGQITRAEFAVLIARALNLPTEEYQGTFKDVTTSKGWAYAGVEAAYRAGIVNGKTADKFDPDAKITREEIATMIVRAIQYQDANLLNGLDTSAKFKDDSSIGTFAKDSVKKAAALGIVTGKTNGTFVPKATATRAESAVMIYRALDKLEEF